MADKKVKKFSKKTESTAGGTARTIMESANQIWLAGLGAFAKAQEEGGKIFDTLVQEGQELESKTRKTTSSRVNEVRGAVEGTVGQARARATESWDKLEKVFEDRVARALNSLGVPTSRDVQELSRRVEELQRAVDQYNRSASSASVKTPASTAPKTAAGSSNKPETPASGVPSKAKPASSISKKKTTRKKKTSGK